MTKVFYCSTLFGAMTLSAAIDAGCFGAHDERRLLIVSTNSVIPEITPAVDEVPAFDALRGRFDDVVSWNDVVAPLHPADWSPRASEVPMLARMVCARFALSEVSELVVESIAVAPARTIARLVRDCPITVFSDGLMSYGPTRDALPVDISGRLRRVLYLDLVPALEPLLLREYGVAVEAVADSAFARVLAELPAPAGAAQAHGCPVILGQYLAAIGIMTPIEEAALHDDLLRALVAGGHRHVVFKPHPAAGLKQARQLRVCAADLGVRLTVVGDAVSAEAWFRDARPELVVSCFSTALLTAAHYFGLPVATMGCPAALERITPYENSNRIPTTIVDAVVPELRPDGSRSVPPALDVAALVRAVGFCMQPKRHPDLRPGAAEYLQRNGSERYFKRRRLEATGLLTPPIQRSPSVARARRLARLALARGARSASGVRRYPLVAALSRRS